MISPLAEDLAIYGARLLSSQYGVDFSKSHYEDIKKVYSIWICTTPTATRKNAITRYRLVEEVICGDNREEVQNYDLMQLILVTLGEEGQEEEDLLRFFNILFSKKLPKEDKIHLLKTEFDFQMNDSMEGDVTDMCNLGRGVLLEGIQIGQEQGIQIGEERGYKTLAQKIMNMMKKASMTYEDAIDLLGCTEEELLKCRPYLNLPS